MMPQRWEDRPKKTVGYKKCNFETVKKNDFYRHLLHTHGFNDDMAAKFLDHSLQKNENKNKEYLSKITSDLMTPLHHPPPLPSPPPPFPPPSPPYNSPYGDDPADLPPPTDSARRHAAAACTEKQYPEVKGDGTMGRGKEEPPLPVITRARTMCPQSSPLSSLSPLSSTSSSSYEPATPPATTRNTDLNDGKTKQLSTRAFSTPSKFTVPRKTPVKTSTKKEQFEMWRNMETYELLEIIKHESCPSIPGGFKLKTRWTSEPSTVEGYVDWHSYDTVYKSHPRILQAYYERTWANELIASVVFPASTQSPPPRLPIPRGGVVDHRVSTTQARLTPFGKKVLHTLEEMNGKRPEFTLPLRLPTSFEEYTEMFLPTMITLHAMSIPLNKLPPKKLWSKGLNMTWEAGRR
jgi:hypothetical protein